MRSAYGRQTPAPDYELTCVEPGSPMGELLRRYWQPVCTSDEFRDVPKKVKLLCEELVVFRDKRGAWVPSSRIARTAVPTSNGAGSKRKGCVAVIMAGSTTRKANASTCPARRKSSASAWRFGIPLTRPWNMAGWSSSIWDRPVHNRSPDVRHYRHQVPQRCRAARQALIGRVFRRLCQRLQLAAALREHCRSIASRCCIR